MVHCSYKTNKTLIVEDETLIVEDLNGQQFTNRTSGDDIQKFAH